MKVLNQIELNWIELIKLIKLIRMLMFMCKMLHAGNKFIKYMM